MKKFLLIFALIVSLFSLGCQKVQEGSEVSVPSEKKMPTNQLFELTEAKKIFLNSAESLPVDGNTLKVFDLCYEPVSKHVFAVGIMTKDMAVFDENLNLLSYQETELKGKDYSLKYLSCDGGLVSLSTEDEVLLFDAVQGNKIGNVSLDSKAGVKSSKILADLNMLVVATTENEQIFYDLDSLEEIQRLAHSRSSYFVDGDKLLLLEMDSSSKSFSTYYYDAKTLKELSKDSWKVSFVIRDFAYNPETKSMYLLDRDGAVFDLSLLNVKEKPVKLGKNTYEEVMAMFVKDNNLILVSANGFDGDTDGNFFGGVSKIDLGTNKVSEYPFPFKHNSVAFNDSKGWMYLMDNDGNSISQIDLKDYSVIKRSLTGTSAEQGVWTKDGALVVANRLGGSYLYVYDSALEYFGTIEPWAWPVSTYYDSVNDRILSYDFLASSISVFDAKTLEQIDNFDLGVADGASDSLGFMSYDEDSQMAYVSIPEQGLIVIYDLEAEKTLGSIQIPDFDKKLASELQGPGNLLAFSDSIHQRLFVLEASKNLLHVYTLGSGEPSLYKTIAVENEMQDLKDYPLSMKMDLGQGILWLGSYALNLETLTFDSQNTNGTNFIAYDPAREVTIFAGLDGEEEFVYVQNLSGELVQTVPLGAREFVLSNFAYEQESGVLAAFHMVSSTIDVIPLFAE